MSATKVRIKNQLKCRCGTELFTVMGDTDGYYLVCTNEKCGKKKYVII